MSLQPLLDTHWVVQLHVAAAITAIVLGAIQIAAPKGTLPHKSIGAIWILLMTAIAVSSIFIVPALHPGAPVTQWFTWIHIFTVITFYCVIRGSQYLLSGGPSLKRHGRLFIGLFIGGLIVAGGFTFMPGRLMHEVVFG